MMSSTVKIALRSKLRPKRLTTTTSRFGAIHSRPGVPNMRFPSGSLTEHRICRTVVTTSRIHESPYFHLPQRGLSRQFSSEKLAPKPRANTMTVRRVLRNKEIVSLGEQQKWKEILGLWEKESPEYTEINYATTLTQLKNIPSFEKTNPIFQELMDELAVLIEDRGLRWVGHRQLANIAHAIGKMQFQSASSQRIFDFIAQEKTAHAFMTAYDRYQQSAANVCLSMAKLRDSKNLSLFLAVLKQHATWFVAEADSPQNLANVAWACGTLRIKAPRLFGEIDRRSAWMVEQRNPQNVSNTAWACARLNFVARNLFHEINTHSAWLVDQGTTQNVANTAWACGKLRIRTPKLFHEIDRQSAWLVEKGTPQDVANIAWACGKLNISAPKLFHAIEKRSAWLIAEGTPQNVANTAWACGNLGVAAPGLFQEIEANWTYLANKGKWFDMETMARAASKLRVTSPNFLAEIKKLQSRQVKRDAWEKQKRRGKQRSAVLSTVSR